MYTYMSMWTFHTYTDTHAVNFSHTLVSAAWLYCCVCFFCLQLRIYFFCLCFHIYVNFTCCGECTQRPNFSEASAGKNATICCKCAKKRGKIYKIKEENINTNKCHNVSPTYKYKCAKLCIYICMHINEFVVSHKILNYQIYTYL